MKLSFVIPTVNQFTMLFNECIDTFIRHNGSGHEIIVVDDGSTISQDRTPGPLQPKIKAECEKRGVKFLSNEVNSGFPITSNKGIAAATGDIVTIINNDIQFTQNIADPLVDSFAKDPTIGIVGGLLFYPDGTIQHGGIELVHGSAFTHRGWHKTLPTAPEVKREAYLIGVTGAVFGLRKTMIDKIGAFREDYFLACEDTEFCLRAWSSGWKVFYNPAIQAIHREGATRGRTDVEKQRKHRAWYIREQQTFQKFRNDIKSFDLPNILKDVAEANGSKVSPAPLKSRSTTSEAVLIQSGLGQADVNSGVVDQDTIFIKRSGALGDVLMGTGVIRAIRQSNGGKRIVFATNSPDAVKGNPNIDLVVPANTLVPKDAKLIDFDLCYESNPRKEVWKTYAVAAGVSEAADLSFQLASSEHDLESVKKKVPFDLAKERFAVVHMAISWASRTWPRTNWLEVCRKLTSGGYKVITVGKGADYRSDLYSGVINLVDRLTITEIRELCKRASVFVGMDSGLLHVAQTTDVPVVGLFTVADPKYRIYPRPVKSVAVVPKSECRYCLHEQAPPVTFVACKFGTNACLSDISPDSVVDAVREVSR